MAATAPLHADRGNGRTYTAADRRRSGETSTHGGLTDGHLKLHPDLHLIDGRDYVEATSREILMHALRGEGYAVDTAPSAAAAVRQLGSERYALVIADWVLPDGNGIDVADYAANLGAKTIVISGYLFRLPAGAAERHQLMMKPITPNEIVSSVRRAIGRGRAET